MGALTQGRGLAVAFLAVSPLWMFAPGVSSSLSQATEARLQQLAVSASKMPKGERRFGAVLQAAFAMPPGGAASANPMEQNRAALLALGVAIGHERLALFIRLDPKDPSIRDAAALRRRTALSGREDWARHFCLSAALAVLENPMVSDTGGLIKEQLDALTHGSGFSFGDLAADRAGVRFAMLAIRSEADARAMQARLQSGIKPGDLFPRTVDLPENLTVEQFRQEYGGIGSARYRQKVAEIEALLDQCPGLSAQSSSP
jgi:hypothetical protein